MRSRLPRDIFLVLAIVFVGLRLLSIEPWDDSVDAFAYWSTRDGSFYGGPIGADGAGQIGAYLYSPAFAQLLTPFVQLPWPVFAAGWTALNLVTLWWLAGRAALPLVLLPPVAFEVVSGNVHLLYAAAIVIGFRFGGTWALVILTKLTPGIGLLWFLVRREWRPLIAATTTTGLLAAISYLLDPAAWRTWVDVIAGQIDAPLQTTGWFVPIALPIRLALAGLIVVWGALTDRRWMLPVAATLALPILWLNGLSVLVACLPLAQRNVRSSTLRERRALTGPSPRSSAPGASDG